MTTRKRTTDGWAYRNNRARRKKTDQETYAPCYLCLEPFDWSLPGNDSGVWSAEHLVPVSMGGSDAYDNIVGTHKLCNIVRGTQPIYKGMFAGKRPVQGETNPYFKEGSRMDRSIWRDQTRPVDAHTIHPETRCMHCPCIRSRWWPDGYDSTMIDAERELAEFQHNGKRLP